MLGSEKLKFFLPLFIFYFFAIFTAGCATHLQRKATSMTYEVKAHQTIVALDEFNVLHQGYGHRILEAGDRSFFEFEVSLKDQPVIKRSFRIFLPANPDETIDWRNLMIKIESCENNGPPHNEEAKVYFKASRLKIIPVGDKQIMKQGDAVYFENGPTLKLRSFGHVDDDDGGATTADFKISFENTSGATMLFLRANEPNAPIVDNWNGWKIRAHKWTDAGPPHTSMQSIEVSVTK